MSPPRKIRSLGPRLRWSLVQSQVRTETCVVYNTRKAVQSSWFIYTKGTVGIAVTSFQKWYPNSPACQLIQQTQSELRWQFHWGSL